MFSGWFPVKRLPISFDFSVDSSSLFRPFFQSQRRHHSHFCDFAPPPCIFLQWQQLAWENRVKWNANQQKVLATMGLWLKCEHFYFTVEYIGLENANFWDTVQLMLNKSWLEIKTICLSGMQLCRAKMCVEMCFEMLFDGVSERTGRLTAAEKDEWERPATMVPCETTFDVASHQATLVSL